jgi:hypothetical protein
MSELLKAFEKRRSIYSLGKTKTVSEQKIREIVETAVKHVPSPFNSQSARVVLLFGSESERFWGIVREALRAVVPPEAFEKTEEKIRSFDAGFGTVLFFEDQSVVTGLQERFALYADNFPIWSLQSNGMLEFAVWTSLADVGVGASLQHYNPLVDEGVRKAWDIPASWKLLAEMPFGSIEAAAGDKEFLPLTDRIRVFGEKK